MAAGNTFLCTIITPEREVLREDATSAVFTAHDGQVGILLSRAPLLTKLGIGTVRVSGRSGEKTFFVDGGFAQMLDNVLTILTQQCTTPDAIDREAQRKALAAAKELPNLTDEEYDARNAAIKRAEVQLALAGA